MDELLTCSMNCQNKPVYACDCSDQRIFLCSNHTGPHGELVSPRNHLYTRITKTPDPQTKIIIFKLIKGLKLQIKQDRLKIIKESSLIIKQVKEAAAISLEKILAIEKKLDEYLYLCDTLEEINNLNSKSLIESLLKLSTEDASKIKFQEDIIKINTTNLKEMIENMFNVQEITSLFEARNFINFKPKIIKYFNDNKDLFTIDVTSQNITSVNIKKNFQRYDPTCLLEDGSVFCCIHSETFIISPNNSIIQLDSSQRSQYSGLIEVNDFIYMIGGIGNVSLKFSLKSKTWASLAQYPVSGNCQISCANLNNMILIGGYSSPYIYGYNVCNNSYTNILITLSSDTGKTCLSVKNKAYIIEYSKNYYESGLNDINAWTSIGTASILSSAHPQNSYSLLYEDSFYFITGLSKLIQFDLKNKQLKDLKTF